MDSNFVDRYRALIKLETPEDIEKWRQERRKNYPRLKTCTETKNDWSNQSGRKRKLTLFEKLMQNEQNDDAMTSTDRVKLQKVDV